jgi:hypothetical protein
MVRDIGLRSVRLQRDAIIAQEEFAVPNKRFLSGGPIDGASAQLASGGRLMIASRWRGSDWACLARKFKREPQAMAKGPGVCVRDSDADGLMDRALLAGSELAIDPVRLVPVHVEGGDEATRVRLILRVVEVGPSTFMVSGESVTDIGRTVPYWRSSIADQDKNVRPWKKTFKFVSGKVHRLGDLRLYMVRRRGQRWIRARGTFNQNARLCNGDTTLWMTGTTLVGG